MKNPIVPLAVAVILIGIAAIANFTHMGRPAMEATIYDDFALSSKTAVSNATRFNAVPDGFKIMCSSDGKFVPAREGYTLDALDYCVRTSYWHAVVAAWRYKEIVDMPEIPQPKQPRRTWEECK